MARLRAGTKRILLTASHTKNFSRGGRKELASRLKAMRKFGRSKYKHQGKLMQKTQGSSYPHRPSITHL